MDYITIAVGVVIIIYGLYTLIMRQKAPEKFAKLEAMKERLGDTPGNTAHIFFYSIMPIVFGSIVVYVGTKGISLAQFIAN